MDKNEVNSAFEILLEEIENVVESLNQEGEKAFKGQNYEKLRVFIANAEGLSTFRGKVRELQKEWRNVFTGKIPGRIKKRKSYKKLQKGLRTPDDNFRIPILESLNELGGKAEMNEVLKKVSEKLKDKLNKYDMQKLASNPSQKRWENTAQWCRNAMVKEGLLSSDSPRGTWEITSEGKKYLREKNNS